VDGKKVIFDARKSAMQAGKGAGAEVPSSKDSELAAKAHDRGFNPIDDAKRGVISSELNSDAGRYKKGPGPV
jgi:hypothetical protein